MTNPAAAKLRHYYKISIEMAERLVKAGFESPGKVKLATKSALMEIEGVGQSTADKLKAR